MSFYVLPFAFVCVLQKNVGFFVYQSRSRALFLPFCVAIVLLRMFVLRGRRLTVFLCRVPRTPLYLELSSFASCVV